MSGCFCTGACRNGGRCPNNRDWADLKYRPYSIETPCANEAMDKWEDQNLPLNKRRGPRMLYCSCPKCSSVSMM